MHEQLKSLVLVIDDDELSREVLRIQLAGEGYRVDVASSGDEALIWLAELSSPPDVVLSDLQMPGLAGEELGRRLRRICGASTRLLAMSGSVPQKLEAEAFEAFLLKPFSMTEFASVLENVERPAAAPRSPRATASDPKASDEVLDPQIFKVFRKMMREDALQELYGACLADAEKQLVLMRADAESGRDDAFRKSAHAIKGSLGMLGARELQQMCAALEESGLAGTSVTTLAEFPDAIVRLRRILVGLGVQL